MRRLRLAAVLLVLTLLAAACSSDGGDEGGEDTAPERTTSTTEGGSSRHPSVTAASLEGPITVGELSGAADPRPIDYAAAGYEQEEWFASGTATAFKADGDLGEDGRWAVSPASTAPYKTRFLVRRPVDPADFNGTVVVEWFNVSAVEASPEWTYLNRALVDAGAAWVGVSVQALGVVGGKSLIQTGDASLDQATGGIRGSNPERYGTLEHPGDAYAYDIYSQVAAAVRAGGDVLGGATPRWVVAAGESQSAFFMTTYVNAIQPVADTFDGFFIHSRGAGAAAIDGLRRDSTEEAAGVHLRTDGDVPVLVFETETDVGPRLRFAEARQPDNDRLRIWEVAGTSHADSHLVGTPFSLCPAGINTGPQHYVTNAAIEALLRWVAGGEPPPSGTPIEVVDDVVQRDASGLARGGIRTPSVDVPVSRLSGEPPPGVPPLCSLFGSSEPFDAATLTSRYGTREDYLRRFDAALEKVIKAGFVRAADRDLYSAEARAVAFP
jgi:hypothetical protein